MTVQFKGWLVACFGILLVYFSSDAQGVEPLADIAGRVLKDGKDAKINPGFAKVLGLTEGQTVIPLKRLAEKTATGTNTCDVSAQDQRTILFTVHEKNLSTFYVTDLSGKLKRAIVNDSLIASGGLTNLPIGTAQSPFEVQKNWWIKKLGR